VSRGGRKRWKGGKREAKNGGSKYHLGPDWPLEGGKSLEGGPKDAIARKQTALQNGTKRELTQRPDGEDTPRKGYCFSGPEPFIFIVKKVGPAKD